jgi:lipoprotein-anchoring transpeptidase ErfK/SrfK
MRFGRRLADDHGRLPAVLTSAACALVLAVLAAGCGSGTKAKLSENSHQTARAARLGSRRVSTVPAPRTAAPTPTRCLAAATTVASASVAYAALVTNTAVIRRQPRTNSNVVARLGRLDLNRFPRVLGVIGVHTSTSCAPDWYRVQLAVLPNGTTGWVRAWAVQTYRVPSRIVVDLSQRRLRLYRSGKLALETPVSVGAAGTPTPSGRYFVNERFILDDASGPFGPDALGISAHSPTLQHVWAEDGPIAIHGTDEPWTIGQAASHGCIRVANDVMRRLFPLAPAGTPVVVQP